MHPGALAGAPHPAYAPIDAPRAGLERRMDAARRSPYRSGACRLMRHLLLGAARAPRAAKPAQDHELRDTSVTS